MGLCINTPLVSKLEDQMNKVWSTASPKISKPKLRKSKANITILKEINGKAN